MNLVRLFRILCMCAWASRVRGSMSRATTTVVASRISFFIFFYGPFFG